MQAQVEEYEQTVWEAAYKGSRVSPALYAVRVMPFVWEDPVTSAGKYDKIKALFSELDRVAEVNMDMKCAFLLPDFGGKQSPKPAGDKYPSPALPRTLPAHLARNGTVLPDLRAPPDVSAGSQT